MLSTAVRYLCWTSHLVKSSMTHPIPIKPAFQGVGSVPGGSAQCNCKVNQASNISPRYITILGMRLGRHDLTHSLVRGPPASWLPMSGITDVPFRRLVLESGCSLAFTEMVSAEGFLRKDELFLNVEKGRTPPFRPAFRGRARIALARAAEKVEAVGADAIDLNMGCPAKKVIGTGSRGWT